MKRAIIITLWFLAPVPGILLYLLGGQLVTMDAGYLSAQLAGISALAWLGGQLYLAAKPWGMDRALGAKTLLGLHIAGAVLGVAAAHYHWAFKTFAAGIEPSLQTLPGFVALQSFVWLGLLALVFLANTPLAQRPWVKALRAWAQEHWGFSYKRLRLVHGLSAFALLAMAAHVLLAWTTQGAWYTVAWAALWVLGGAGLYLAYRLRGRKT